MCEFKPQLRQWVALDVYSHHHLIFTSIPSELIHRHDVMSLLQVESPLRCSLWVTGRHVKGMVKSQPDWHNIVWKEHLCLPESCVLPSVRAVPSLTLWHVM